MDRLKSGLTFLLFAKILIIYLISFSVYAGVYKWLDENGNVQYGDKPVNPKKATELIIDTESRSGITNSSSNKKERDRMLQEQEDDRMEKNENRKQQEAEQAKNHKRCIQGKDSLLRFERSSRTYALNDKGERVYFSEAQRKSREKELNREIARYCH